MTQPAAEQLLNLANRAERGPLSGDEAQRLRDGIRAALGQPTNPEPSWQCPDCGGLVPNSQRHIHQAAEQRARAKKAEAELAALKTITSGYCGHCGRGDCSPTADQWYEQRQRAERAEAAIERIRALHVPHGYPDPDMPGTRTYCGGCDDATSAHPCNTLAALDPQEPQP
ncbi:hypothetical protein ACF09L_19120 [Streptomyces sp. NPDC014779]|uniref:hypothetical protein n=1 Tax=Streptomyces sp. NPDC014779 TaxID=3364911 RepID=UPI0036F9DA48